MKEQETEAQAENTKVDSGAQGRIPQKVKVLVLAAVAGLLALVVTAVLLLTSQDKGLDAESAASKLLTKFDAPGFPKEIYNLTVIGLSNPVFGVEHKDGESYAEVKSGDIFSSCDSNALVLESLGGAESLSSRTLNEQLDSDEYFLYSDRVFQEIVKFKNAENATLFANSVKEGVFDSSCNTGLYDKTYSLRSDIEYTRGLDSFSNITKDVPDGKNAQAFAFTKTLYFSPATEDANWFDIENVTRIAVAVNGSDVTIIRFTLSQLVINEFDVDAFYGRSDTIIDLAIARFFAPS